MRMGISNPNPSSKKRFGSVQILCLGSVPWGWGEIVCILPLIRLLTLRLEKIGELVFVNSYCFKISQKGGIGGGEGAGPTRRQLGIRIALVRSMKVVTLLTAS